MQTRFGYHIIMLEDVRPVKFPALAEVKPRIQQQVTQTRIEELVGAAREGESGVADLGGTHGEVRQKVAAEGEARDARRGSAAR